jgi:hypothetical protein
MKIFIAMLLMAAATPVAAEELLGVYKIQKIIPHPSQVMNPQILLPPDKWPDSVAPIPFTVRVEKKREQ